STANAQPWVHLRSAQSEQFRGHRTSIWRLFGGAVRRQSGGKEIHQRGRRARRRYSRGYQRPGDAVRCADEAGQRRYAIWGYDVGYEHSLALEPLYGYSAEFVVQVGF